MTSYFEALVADGNDVLITIIRYEITNIQLKELLDDNKSTTF